MHNYHAYGLAITSEIELPELVCTPQSACSDIRITLAKNLTDLTGQVTVINRFQISENAYQFDVPGIARYRITNGKEIEIAPLNSEFSHPEIRVYLLGTAIGVALHQLGHLPLHVGALGTPQGAVAFAGESGAGKSTLSAALHRHGYPLLCDDVTVVKLHQHQPLLYPGYPRIKLCQDAVQHFKLDEKLLVDNLAPEKKFHLYTDNNFANTAYPLRNLYTLERTIGNEKSSITPVNKMGTIKILGENTYRPKVIAQLGHVRQHFMQCAEIANHIQVFRYKRPWNLENIEHSLELLLAHIEETTC